MEIQEFNNEKNVYNKKKEEDYIMIKKDKDVVVKDKYEMEKQF